MISLEFAMLQNLNPMTRRNCTLIGKGVLNSGLNAASQMYISIAESVNAITEATRGIPSMAQLVGTLTSPDYDMAVDLLVFWLPAGFSIETQLYFDEQMDSLANFVSLRSTMLAVFLSALAMFFFLVFEPLVCEMDMHVKRVRALLVMIPAEVAMATASLRNALMSSV